MIADDFKAIMNVDYYDERLQLQTYVIIEKIIGVEKQINQSFNLPFKERYLLNEKKSCLFDELKNIIKMEAKRRY